MKSLMCWEPFPESGSIEAQMNRVFENIIESPTRAEYNYFGRTCLISRDEEMSATEFDLPVDIDEAVANPLNVTEDCLPARR